jgi:hypothetical protein
MGFEAIGSIAAPIVGGAIGNMASAGDRAQADELRRRALAEIAGINVPSVAEQEIQLQQLASQGKLTPEIVQAIQQQSSQMQGVSTDPRLKDAQLAALSSLQDIGNNGGMSATDKVRFNQMQSELNRDAGARQAALMQDFARRGQSGSGMELAAQLMNQQSASERASQQGMDVKAQAEQRALQALSQGGQLAGNMQSQEFNQKASQAQAQDAINRFNAANRQQVLSSNVGIRNNAQAGNLQNAQRIADSNVGLNNQQEMYNKGLIQQHFNNQMNRGAALAGQYGNMAGSKDASADRTAGMYAGIGSGVGQGFAAYGKRKPQDEE